MKKNKNYEKMHELSRHAHVLSGVTALLGWDQETYMPADSAGIRAIQMETLAGIVHDASTNKEYKKALEQLVDIKNGRILDKTLTPAQKAAVREWRRDFVKATALPKSFVEEWAKLTSQSIIAWRNAKEKDAFHKFAPFLDKIVNMNRKKAELLGYDKNPYDALLDNYEHGTSTDEVSKIFQKLRKAIVDLLKKVKSSKQMEDRFLYGKFSADKQLKFGKQLLEDMGFDFNKGRLDLSAHPFSSSCHPTDSRVTTRLSPSASIMNNLSTILHEGGHSLYEMGLPVEHYGSPLAEAISLGIHESQSRWWETRIGHSMPFWKHYYPKLQKEFPKLKAIALPNFYKAINKIEPSLIRVESDEVTYALHVILRFELEQDLINGKLSVRQVPEAWNDKMKELLGVVPPSNAKGCLQDIHWAMGAFGYFPTYALGNLYAAQFFESFAIEHPDWEKRLAKGELTFIREWLHHAIHRHGRHYTSQELIKKVTGKPLSADAFIRYLNNKYQTLYQTK